VPASVRVGCTEVMVAILTHVGIHAYGLREGPPGRRTDAVKTTVGRACARYTGDMSIVPRRRAALPIPGLSGPVLARPSTVVRPALQRRLVRRLLEGPHAWGELEVWGGRYGWTSSCLVVFPPGASRSERIRYRAMRTWPAVGILLGVLTTVVVAQRVPFVLAAGAGCAVYAAGALALAGLAGRGRRAIRTLDACRGDEGTVGLERGPAAELDRFAAVLILAERRFRAGDLDAVGFEAVWGAVWQELGDPRYHRP
jgi:hypothetical protein